MVSLCHGLNPHNSSLIMITCINMMRLIGIDSQMIAKDKTDSERINMDTIVQRFCSES